MTGGLLQLVSKGQIDDFLISQPQISYYKYAYKRHTQFSMESRKILFKSINTRFTTNKSNIIECDINRHGDLLSNIYYCFTLPDIYSSDKYRFKWVKNIGNVVVKKASVYVDGTEIDKITGEWMNVWNELTTIDDKYDNMIGNVSELNDPKMSNDRVTIKNNRFIYYYYPDSTKESNIPSIKSREIIVPLNFWFTKTPALALPLIRMQLNTVSIKIEIESSENLYQVYSEDLSRFISPAYYNELYNDNISLYTFVKSDYTLNQYLDANYIFLGIDERNELCTKPTIKYLVEQLTITTMSNIKTINPSSYKLSLNVNIPIKELIWIFRRDDFYKFNDHTNYSPTIPESNNGIMDKATIRFSNQERINEKPAQYFNIIQPYQHHTTVPKNGIYCYSFANYPEKEFLSGYYNAALINSVLDFYVRTDYDNSEINKLLNKIGKNSYDFDYTIYVYGRGYNIFEITGMQAGMKFAS